MCRVKRDNFSLTYEQFIGKPCYLSDLAELFGKDPRTVSKLISQIVSAPALGTQYSSEQIVLILGQFGISAHNFFEIQQQSLDRKIRKLHSGSYPPLARKHRNN